MKEKKQVFVISNTHWDREWNLPLEKYRARLIKMMDRLIKIMEENPKYIFVTDGQFVLVQDYLNVRPEKTEPVKKLMDEGRLKVGPWYTQPLETLITGEAMIRNLYYGLKETRKYGAPMMFSYMVDEFGHASQTPQVLKSFGINDALAWRGIPEKIPAVFEWAAPSGDSVSMHRSVHGYGEATALPSQLDDFTEIIDGTTFKRPGLKSAIENIKALKDSYAQVPVQFWLNGIDHSWAQEDILDVISIVNDNFEEYAVKQSSLEEYAAAIKKALADNKIKLPKLTGELMHPDEEPLVCIHSIRADQKLEHYKAEHLLEQSAEPLCAIAWLCGMDYPLWALQDAWKKVLENHAHDSLGCCSVDSVFTQMMARYDSAIATGEQAIDDAFAYLMSKDSSELSLYVFSTNSAKREGAMTCTFDIPKEFGIDKFCILDENGEKIRFSILKEQNLKSIRYNPKYGHPSNILSKRYHVVIDLGESKGIGCRRFSIVKTEAESAAIKPITETEFGVLENEFFVVTIKKNGCINIHDKRTNIDYLEQLQLADSADKGNFYFHRRPAFNTVITNAFAVADIKKIVQNELLTEYEISYSIDIPKTLTTDYHARSCETEPLDIKILLKLLKGSPRIDVELSVKNRCRYHQLRILFPTGMTDANTSLSGQPFDIVERPLGIPQGFANTVKDPNTEYHPMQNFCAVQGDNAGLIIAAKGIYEYEAVNDESRTLALTLFRSTEMDRQPAGDADDKKTQLSYLFKTMKYDLSIIPFAGNYLDAYPQVVDFINPAQIIFKRSTDEYLLEASKNSSVKPQQTQNLLDNIIDIDGEHVFVTALKREDNGNMLIVRLLNLSAVPQDVTVSLTHNFMQCKNVWHMNFNEEKLNNMGGNPKVKLKVNSKEVFTLGFELEYTL